MIQGALEWQSCRRDCWGRHRHGRTAPGPFQNHRALPMGEDTSQPVRVLCPCRQNTLLPDRHDISGPADFPCSCKDAVHARFHTAKSSLAPSSHNL